MSDSGNNWQDFGESWQRNQERLLAPRKLLNRKIIEFCGLKPKGRLLDFGTGLGEPALTAAKMHPEVTVEGLDTSTSLVEFANRRARRDNVANFRSSLVEEHRFPFEKDRFDAVTSSFALEFSDRWRIDLKEIARVLASGGNFVMSCWLNDLESNPFQCLIPSTIKSLIGPRALAQDRLFRFHDREALNAECRLHGLKPLSIDRYQGHFPYESIEDFWTLKIQASPSVSGDMAALKENEKRLVMNEVARQLGTMKDAKGLLSVPFCAEIFRFTKEKI